MKIADSKQIGAWPPAATKLPHTRERRKEVNAAQDIQDWLVSKFSELLSLSADEIDVFKPLDSYGLGSIQAVSLTGDLEDWLGLTLPATLLWDYSTIDVLARHLAEELNLAQSNSSATNEK
jgi:acyl carrier protein